MEINPETNYISQQPKNSHLAGLVYLSNSVTQKCHFEALAMLYLSVIFMYKKKKKRRKKASFSVILGSLERFASASVARYSAMCMSSEG